MHIEVFVIGVVISWGRPDVPLLVYEDSVVVCQNSPHSNIKLSIMEEQWPLDIFLYYPVSNVAAIRINKVGYWSEFIENLYSFSLVCICRFDQPHIIFTVFPWHAFFVGTAFCKLVEAVHHRGNFAVICSAGYHKRSGSWIETWIVGLDCRWKVRVVLF